MKEQSLEYDRPAEIESAGAHGRALPKLTKAPGDNAGTPFRQCFGNAETDESSTAMTGMSAIFCALGGSIAPAGDGAEFCALPLDSPAGALPQPPGAAPSDTLEGEAEWRGAIKLARYLLRRRDCAGGAGAA